MSQAESSKKKPTKKEIEEENAILQERVRRYQEIVQRLEGAEESERSRETSGMPERVVKQKISEILGELNKNILNLPENINKAIKEGEVIKKDLTTKNLSMNFEEYQEYLGRISNINNYINKQISDVEFIDITIFDYIEEVEPGFKERNSELYKLISNYNKSVSEFLSSNDIEYITDFYNENNLDFNKIEIKPLPNIDPEIKKRESLKKIQTLPGTNNILFTKLKSDKKTSYDEILGDYIRLDIDKAIPCKLRYNEKEGQNPFYVLQGDKKFVFNNIGLAKSFCLNGGYQADFINAKRNIDFDKKYKNTYVPAYVLR